MSEPETILAHAARLLRGGRLAGRRIVVTAGPTRESIDPVRVVTNRSSGKMGYRVAEAAWERGADVVLISGPVAGAADGVTLRRVESTERAGSGGRSELPGGGRAGDGRGPRRLPAQRSEREQAEPDRRRAGDPDGADRGHPERYARGAEARQLIVGFALETGDALAKGRAKLERKDLDLIVVNDALEPGAGFEHDTNRVAILGRDGTPQILPLQSKREVAEAILDAVERYLG